MGCCPESRLGRRLIIVTTLTKEYDYSYLRDIFGHLAALMFVKATDLGMPHLAKIGLTTKESTIIEFVGNNPEASQKEIARETGTKQSLLVTILDSLTKRGLLVRERSAVDRRRQHVRLTDEGEALRESIKELQYVSNDDLIGAAGLTAEEVDTLVSLMQKVVNTPV